MRTLLIGIIMLMATAAEALAQVPAVKVEDAKGALINTATLVDGKTPFIISFWATTCKPCIRELDAVNEQMPDWLDLAKFRVVAVSTDDNRSSAKARALAEGHGWDDFTLLYDKNQELMRAMNVTLTPQVYVVDANGKIVYSHTGYAPGNENELIKAIQKLQK